MYEIRKRVKKINKKIKALEFKKTMQTGAFYTNDKTLLQFKCTGINDGIDGISLDGKVRYLNINIDHNFREMGYNEILTAYTNFLKIKK